MSLGGKQPATQTVVNSTQPPDFQVPHLQAIFQNAANQYNRPISLPQTSFYVPPAADSNVAANLLRQNAQGAQAQMPLLGGALQFGLQDALRPESNPYMQQFAQQATKNLTDAFGTDVLPQIRSGAQSTGNFDSTRHGIAEGLASRALTDSIAQLQADIYNKGYGQNLDNFGRTLALAPQTIQAGTLPPTMLDAVGMRDEALRQRALDEQLYRFNFSQLEPISRLAQYQNFVTGNFGSDTTQQMVGARPGGSRGQGLLGGALMGASIGTAVPGITPGIGALAGAILGLLG